MGDGHREWWRLELGLQLDDGRCRRVLVANSLGDVAFGPLESRLEAVAPAAALDYSVEVEGSLGEGPEVFGERLIKDFSSPRNSRACE